MIDTRLLQILRLLYHQTDADQAQIEAQLIAARQRAWMTAIQQEARRWGWAGPVQAPRREDLEWIRLESKRDAASIANTWNRDVDRQLDRLYAQNPRGNRFYYRKHMEAWAAERDVWKSRQIATQTEMSTANYAIRRFEEMNGLRGGLKIFTGPPPVCGDCVNLYALGPVPQRTADLYPCPRHIGCTHSWVTVAGSVSKPDPRDLWVG